MTTLTPLQPNTVLTPIFLHNAFQDAVSRGDTHGGSVGRVILPATHNGSPRHMHQLYQDAMAIVRAHGKPTLFITVTTNPKWPEITDNLLPGQVC